MDEQWIGKGVDLDCGPLGVFQGVINAVHLEEQTITMKNVIHNGVPSKMSSITIEARDIKGIEFIEAQTSANAQARKQATSTITIAKKKTRPVAENLAMNSSNHIRKSQSPAVFGIADHRMSPKKPAEAASGFSAYNKQKGSYHQRDEACFDIDLNSIHSKEFDFEHNLALFDKHRVLQEIESNQPDVVRLIDHNRRGNKTTTSTTTGASKAAATAPPPSHGHRKAPEPKYRNDQNVLSSAPTKVRGIATEEAAVGEYMTDAGLIVPAISYKLRERFMAAAEARGISRERLTELVARAGTELAVQLLGGSRRLNPSNSHQLPLCVILCGPGQTGAYGLAISRHLAAQGVKTLAYLPHLSLYPTHLASELSLYKLCCKGSMCKFTNDVKELPVGTVDLVVMAVDDHEIWEQERGQPWHKGAIRWCNELRAPVLAVDPLSSPYTPSVPTRASLVPGLPLWYEGGAAGKIYMVNLAIPIKVYKDVGIAYVTPFGAKSTVTLDPVVG